MPLVIAHLVWLKSIITNDQLFYYILSHVTLEWILNSIGKLLTSWGTQAQHVSLVEY